MGAEAGAEDHGQAALSDRGQVCQDIYTAGDPDRAGREWVLHMAGKDIRTGAASRVGHDGNSIFSMRGGDRMMAYKGKYERTIDRKIAAQARLICINWINIGSKEAVSGGADRITANLLKSGYRPDGAGVHPDFREAYEAGDKVSGKYIRLPQEAWKKIEGQRI